MTKARSNANHIDVNIRPFKQVKFSRNYKLNLKEKKSENLMTLTGHYTAEVLFEHLKNVIRQSVIKHINIININSLTFQRQSLIRILL